jgi:hypothetical protein
MATQMQAAQVNPAQIATSSANPSLQPPKMEAETQPENINDTIS